MSPLSPEEIEAEQLYLESIYFRVSYREAVIRARNLEARSEIAGKYLRWLLQRKMQCEDRILGMTIKV